MKGFSRSYLRIVLSSDNIRLPAYTDNNCNVELPTAKVGVCDHPLGIYQKRVLIIHMRMWKIYKEAANRGFHIAVQLSQI